MLNRRQFIQSAGLAFGSAGMWDVLGQIVRRAGAVEPEAGSSFYDAEHVVILMQENRSFDHCFGSLAGVRGFNDPRAIRLPDGNPVWAQTDASGRTFLPFRLNLHDTRATWMGSLPHSWESQVDARNHGMHDKWLQAKRPGEREYADMPLTMGYYTREDIPFYYELADAFTVCDQHFCSSLTGTTPNRLHLWTGTIRAEQSARSQANVANEDADYGNWVRWTTFAERLEDLGIPWKVYQNELSVESGLAGGHDAWLTNFGDNPLEYFEQFNVRLSKTYRDHLARQLESLPTEIEDLKKQLAGAALPAQHRAKLQKQLKSSIAGLDQARIEIKTCNAGAFEKLSARQRSLHERAFVTNAADPAYRELSELSYVDGSVRRQLQVPRGDVLHQFRQDVQSGRLPAVSWIVAPERFSDHPSSPWYGAWYIAETLAILTRDPELWKKTIFILTYDENDGYFDHVPPFVAPHPSRPESGKVSAGIDPALEYVELEQDRRRVPAGHPRESSIGLGYRVPMVIASPWTRGGCVCSQVFDHTSVPQFLETFLSHKTGKPVTEPNISQWRRTVCGDLTSAFQPASKPGGSLAAVDRNQVVEAIHRAQYKPLPAGFAPLSKEQLEAIRRGTSVSSPMPRQEPGVRPSCPLPYELYVDATVDVGRSRLTVRFEAGKKHFGERSAGCPFTAYAVGYKGQTQIRSYAVSPGDRLEDSWELADFRDGIYHVTVHGPNGFYRKFAGAADSSAVDVRAAYATDTSKSLDGNLEILATNQAGHPLTMRMADQSYGGRTISRTLPPGTTTTIQIETAADSHWYDLAIKIEQIPHCEYRLAGRIETGRWTVSDPAMGRA